MPPLREAGNPFFMLPRPDGRYDAGPIFDKVRARMRNCLCNNTTSLFMTN